MQFQEKEKIKNTLDKESYKVLLDLPDEGFFVIEMHIHPNEPLDFKSIDISKTFGKQSSLRNVNRKIVLRNLIPNGIKFPNTYGKITISVVPKENEPEISFLENWNKQNKWENCFKIGKNISSLERNGEEGSGLGICFVRNL